MTRLLRTLGESIPCVINGGIEIGLRGASVAVFNYLI
jgi:hypothetical protein